MQIMENIPISRSIFLIGIAVFQGNKFIVCRLCILLTARIHIGILPDAELVGPAFGVLPSSPPLDAMEEISPWLTSDISQ